MKYANMKIFIEKDFVNAEGNVKCIVGISYLDPVKDCEYGDIEGFDGPDLTNEQICNAVQRMLMNLLPMVNYEEPVTE